MGSNLLANIARQERIKREVLQKSELIPSLPEVVTEVMRLLNDSGVKVSDFEKPLQNDAPIVARMLRVVNSPLYGLSRHITSIKEAVTVLGFRSLRSLVLAAGTANYLERNFSCYGHNEKGLWNHSLCVASAAKFLAQHTKQSADFREEIFVAGLLHDIGKLLLGPYLVNENVNWAEETKACHEVEISKLGLDHQEAGAMVAAKWNLSPMVQAVLCYHHGDGDKTKAPEEYRTPLAIVRLADAFAHEFGKGFVSGFKAPVDVMPEDLVVLGIQEEQWLEIKPLLREAMEAALASIGNG